MVLQIGDKYRSVRTIKSTYQNYIVSYREVTNTLNFIGERTALFRLFVFIETKVPRRRSYGLEEIGMKPFFVLLNGNINKLLNENLKDKQLTKRT